jgi:hypothetical protein
VPRGRGYQLGPVEGDPSELDQAGLSTEAQHLEEQVGEPVEVTTAKAGKRAVVGAALALSQRKATSVRQLRSISRDEVTPVE